MRRVHRNKDVVPRQSFAHVGQNQGSGRVLTRSKVISHFRSLFGFVYIPSAPVEADGGSGMPKQLRHDSDIDLNCFMFHTFSISIKLQNRVQKKMLHSIVGMKKRHHFFFTSIQLVSSEYILRVSHIAGLQGIMSQLRFTNHARGILG